MTTSTNTWRPRRLRDSDEGTYAVLVDGIPSWLENSLWRWAMDRAAQGGPALVYQAERLLRIQLPAQTTSQSPFAGYWTGASEDERLDLLDFFLNFLLNRGLQARKDYDEDKMVDAVRTAERLDEILVEGGSLWTVTFDPDWRLIRRVTEAAQDQLAQAREASGDAGKRVAAAWSNCYRQHPDYDAAYRDAVLAVEAVVLPVTSPKDATATLGKALAHIRDTRDAWSIGGLEAEGAASVDTLLALLATLWRNQQRHARNDGTIHDVSRDEAESAVSLAVTVVHLFSSGLVTRA